MKRMLINDAERLFIILVIAIALFIAAKQVSKIITNKQSNKEPVAMQTQKEQEEITLTVIQFSAEWCPPCRQLKQLVTSDEEIKQAIKENYKAWHIIDVDNPSPWEKKMIDQFSPQGIPLVIMGKLDENSELSEVKRFMGAKNKKFILNWLK